MLGEAPAEPVAGSIGTIGSALYRLGLFEKALPYLTAATKVKDDVLRTGDQLFLAMTLHQIGRDDEANKVLQKALTSISDAERMGKLGWADRIELQTLRAEANKLLKNNAAKGERENSEQWRPPIF